MRFKALLALVGVALTLFALAGCDSNETPSGFTVSGVVQNMAGEPVASGTTLQLRSVNTGAVVATATTGANGTYSFRNVPAGSYLVQVTGPTVTRSFSGVIQVTNANVSRNIQVAATEEIPEVPFPTNGTATLIVQAVNAATGSPTQVGVQVDNLTGLDQTFTSPYTVVTGITPGTYDVTLTNPSTNQTITVIHNVTFTANSRVLIMGVQVSGGLLNYSVSGTVNDLAGNPVNGATVRLIDNSGNIVASGTSGVGGAFTINNVPPGTYSVVAGGTGFTTTLNGQLTVDNNVTEQQVTVATPTQLTQMSIPAPTSTQGTLLVYATDPFTGQPVNVTVSAAGQQATGTSPVAIGSIAPGTYDVTITNSETVVAQNVQIQANNLTVLSVQITPATGGNTVSGSVFYTNSAPASNVGVALLQNGTIVRQTTADASGNYTLTNVPSGTYQLAVTRSVGGTPTMDIVRSGLTVSGDMSGINAEILTATQVSNYIGAQPPTGSPTLLVSAVNSSDQQVPVTVDAQGQTFTGTPVVTTALSAGTTNITATPQGGPTLSFPSIPLVNGRITVIWLEQAS